jgi:hypothetical protein
MTEIIAKGELSDGLVNTIAEQRGVAPEQIRTQIAAIRTAYETQARTMAGPIADTAFSWTYQNDPQLMTDAIKAHVQGESGKRFLLAHTGTMTTPASVLTPCASPAGHGLSKSRMNRSLATPREPPRRTITTHHAHR